MKNLLLFVFLFCSIPTLIFSQELPGAEAPAVNLGKHFVHIATVSNSTSNWTTIDNPNTNTIPDAKLFITHNYNASGSGVYNNHVSGLWYNTGDSKWTIFSEDNTTIPENSAYHILVADETQSTVFQHVANSGNIIQNYTIISNPELDGNPDARILVTQIIISPDYRYNNREIGVWYNGSNWAIFNQNLDAMPEGAAFNVLVLNDENSFIQTATLSNIQGSTTKIDHPALNNNPSAIIYVTQNWNPGGIGGVYNTQKVSTYYNGSQWTIYNEDNSTMVTNSKYNVYFGSSSFVHNTLSSNISGNLTYFDNPLVNRDPDALVFALHNWNPFGTPTTVYNKTLGVFYFSSVWGIFNEDQTLIPEGVYFNTAIAPKTDSAFLHTTTASNISGGNYTIIDNPLINGNPDAKILVQQRYISSWNNVNVGVWYDGSKWTIFNEDFSPMLEGKDFNVWLLNDNKSFVHTVDAASTSLNPVYSYIDNPLTNNNPDANILVTSILQNSGYFDHVQGVWYDASEQKWVLYNEDLTDYTLGIKYIIYVANSSGIPTAVEEENNPATVSDFALQQNYPNPFNPTTQIRFSLPEQSEVTLKVYNILGKEIATLVNDVKGAGVHEVSFDGTGLASGVYFYTLQTDKYTQTHKMILIK
jgi:hypothetical protein